MHEGFAAIASAALALVPVIIWLRIITKGTAEKSLYVKTFLLGTLSVIPPFIIIFVFNRFPQFDIYSEITRTVQQVALASLFTNIVVGVVEEIAKNLIVRIIDKRHPEYVQTISSALRLSICAGLGFSFAENIFYFYNVWMSPQYGVTDLASTFIFRSVFTMCAHMVFSGIFGYYFGLGKFSAELTEYAAWEGRHMGFIRFLSRMTGEMMFEVVREIKNLQGLFIAMAMHASFNAALDLDHKLISIAIVGGGVAYISYLLQTKSGHLLFTMGKRKLSTMAARDEDVVIELLGMWTKEGKLKEVIEICDRLLARDPDNNVVKLFRAKAGDNEELKNVYHALKTFFEKEKMPVMVGSGSTPQLSTADEKVILEVMDTWYQSGNYSKVLEIANRLFAKNPQSSGAQVLLQKSMDKEKMRTIFESLSKLFYE